MLFVEALKKQCESQPRRKFRARRILRLINSRPSKLRDFRLKRLEDHARTFLVHEGVADSVGAIDWENIDWGKFFDNLLKFLLAIFTLFAGKDDE